MDASEEAYVEVRHIEDAPPSQNWIWRIWKSRFSTSFNMEFDGHIYTYPLADAATVTSLICTDHVRRHRDKQPLLITSNLGFTDYLTSGAHLAKDLAHTVQLFQSVDTVREASYELA